MLIDKFIISCNIPRCPSQALNHYGYFEFMLLTVDTCGRGKRFLLSMRPIFALAVRGDLPNKSGLGQQKLSVGMRNLISGRTGFQK